MKANEAPEKMYIPEKIYLPYKDGKVIGLVKETGSCAAIEGAKMNSVEREALQERLRECVKWIDSRI